MEKIILRIPGIIFCAILAVICTFLGNKFPIIGGPVFAILLGMVIAYFYKDMDKTKDGIAFTSKKILQYAVILLGFSMNIVDILSKGKQSLPVIISTILTSLIVAYFLSKLLNIPRKISILIGVGSSICGGSAIAATSPVINAKEDEIAQAISVIFLFNVIAALIFPAIGDMLHLSNNGFALFAGTAINDTSSVTAAASIWDGIHGSNTLSNAALVKLTRTLAIIPITFILALYETNSSKKNNVDSTIKESSKNGVKKVSISKIFPWFVLYFLLASIITSIFKLPAELIAFLKSTSKFFIVMAMAAIGLKTDLINLIKSGGKPILLGFICWASIALVSILVQKLIGVI